MPKQASRIALAAAAAITITLPLSGTASAMNFDRHEVARTTVTVKATTGQIALARKDVMQAGGQVVRWLPAVNGFVAQVPVTAVVGLSSAPGIASITAQGPLIQV